MITWMTHLVATGAAEVDQLCGLKILQTSPHPTFLKEKIYTAFQKVTSQLLHHTWDAISSRYELCRLRQRCPWEQLRSFARSKRVD